MSILSSAITSGTRKTLYPGTRALEPDLPPNSAYCAYLELCGSVHPRIFHADEHDIDFERIDADALTVIRRLQEAGFTAYLVGGGVRDLLAKKRPKDFDISTSARPEQIKHIFRRQCLIIGRRFRLAHIRFGKKIIEVSTFRSGEDAEDLIVRDNQWGSPEEDALRRDFTINGLFYEPCEHHVIDYVGGWDDIHAGVIRTIGDPVIRFRQDPVRMIRLLKFRARFGYHTDPETEKALIYCRDELAKSSPARLLEEIFRMLESGASAEFFNLLQHYEFLEMLFPWLAHFLDTEYGEEVYMLLNAVDRVHKEMPPDQRLDRSLLCACLIYPILESEVDVQYTDKDIVPNLGEITNLASTLSKAVASSSFSQFPRRQRMATNFILTSQYRLTPINQRYYFRAKLVRHPEFALALQFLQLRCDHDPELRPIYEKWVEAGRDAGPVDDESSQRKRRRRRPRRRRPRGDSG